jgi:dTDP-4-amino-4,6-dideoxygalactose transaminase
MSTVSGPLRVPLLDLTLQYAGIRAEIRAAIDRVCDAQHFILGAEVAALESELAAYCQTRFAVGVSSGTDALLAAFMALDVGPGDEVVVPAYSFFATAGTAVRLGARPVFVDIDPESFNLDAATLPDAITSRTRAVVPVHLFGRCADMAAIQRAAAVRDVAVVEDAAQAIGGRDASGRPAGAMGAMGCLSFYPTKNLGAFGDAGLVLTSDGDLDHRLRMLRVHGETARYEHAAVGGNFRLDALQAAVLRVKLAHLPGWNRARGANADRYRRLFAEAGVEETVRRPVHVDGHAYHQFVVLVEDRDALRAFLQERGIGTAIYYPIPLHLQPCFRDLGHKPGDFPAAEAAARHSLALPIYPELTEAQQQYVVDTIAAFYRK